MAADGASTTGDERCATALEAALSVAIEECVPEDQLGDNIARMLGSEPDPDCSTSLAEGLDEATCEDFAGLRQWVACRTIELIEDDNVGFTTAMEDAWAEAKTACANNGVEV